MHVFARLWCGDTVDANLHVCIHAYMHETLVQSFVVFCAIYFDMWMHSDPRHIDVGDQVIL